MSETISRRIYFDWAATAIPLRFDPAGSYPWGNPSSLHEEGKKAREALEGARRTCAHILGVPEHTLFFTSGGTESNALVIHSLLLRPGKPGILYGATEHPSVRENAEILRRLEHSVGIIPVESDGRILSQTLFASLEKFPRTRLVCLMGVNNETGAIHDIPRLVRELRIFQSQRGGPPLHIHCDLVQTLGKIPFSLQEADIDSAAMSAHKLGGPRGIGLLYCRKKVESLLRGGEQEGGLRPGTENVWGAMALAHCFEQRALPSVVRQEHLAATQRMALLIRELSRIPGTTLIPADRSPEDPRFSPYILQVAFQGMPGEVMVRTLNDQGFAVSTGSACSAAHQDRPILKAMGVPEEIARRGIRISQGWTTTEEDIRALVATIFTIIQKG
ncbi:MAG TPA: cysteine desulfurase family protein [Termitinemataceae bacterium]|nr:cysteine desulfurase family protein [Termitinemataceae bacterium]HOM24410.1 cysteine desulfurase family protein [Termitinemataceae bacterium]HPQ01298.1 cysteine desulfurase family protein [Termitinemataceae bacterium]